ncbi:hypothetical protein [Vibrio vulnificus YJ016]|uniref:Uncharacterized protein n=1 Tax=Vibrio vulnificus (strain YJ016) TaxID=196600 RepID=Q7MGS3_VIBVY|nr:hypothetical protein [Vibrio vulnificus YJ016]
MSGVLCQQNMLLFPHRNNNTWENSRVMQGPTFPTLHRELVVI